MGDELLREIVIIKWGVVCLVFMCWCRVLYLLGKEIPIWWDSYNKKKKKFTLEQMKKDLAGAERPRTMKNFKSEWD